MSIGTESPSRRRNQKARNRRFSNTRRQDSKGRNYKRAYNRSQSQSESWDWIEYLGSRSRLENYECNQSGKRDQYRKSSNRENKGGFTKCNTYMCSTCKEIRTKVGNTKVNLLNKDMEVNLCIRYVV